MPIQNEEFDQLKIDKLKHFLETMEAKGQPKPFEIFVDALKVVPKTEDPKEFENYEFYMNEDTQKIRILIYNSNLSPRNDQYNFLVQRQQNKPMNGLGEIENIIQEKLAARDKEYEFAKLKEDLEETKQKLEEAEEYAEDLEGEIEKLKANKYNIKGFNIGEIASVALENFVTRNPQIMAKIPMGNVLS
jgi:predicted nuclease with TOPRIM domain